MSVWGGDPVEPSAWSIERFGQQAGEGVAAELPGGESQPLWRLRFTGVLHTWGVPGGYAQRERCHHVEPWRAR